MVKFFHEAPNSIFNRVQEYTDGDYALVHLFEENEVYKNHFKSAVESGREVILDNSIFELGEAYDDDEYVKWIKWLNPTWYIVPDVLEDSERTLLNINKWECIHKKHNIQSKKIGVVQGKSQDDIIRSIILTAPFVDMVAISFDYSYYVDDNFGFNKPDSWMRGRQRLLRHIDNNQWILQGKKVHLLGVGLPQEGIAYRDYDWVYSIDTSNPVVAGMESVIIEYNGLPFKISKKLHTMINYEVSEAAWDRVKHNIQIFKGFWK